ncbi:zinc-binding dehydrogenase [Dietzia sp. IN118]|uniref:zinc-binding dehydrogenase n=1 Tax=Dietzia sp. IN118 TaxID=3061631 RepID=UPI00293B13DE|nr:zinc-binding dehydrogenase [Dietzia sp. IN118]MDV3354478.1 zinc-binding dehydrogenase [Dietzia sp. IN118]
MYATDTKREAIAAAEKDGAIGIPSEGAAEKLKELTGGRGIDVVSDFVGAAPTLELAARPWPQQGALTVVGLAGADFPWHVFRLPFVVNFSSTYWGTFEALCEVVEPYRAGEINPEVHVYSFDNALRAYQELVVLPTQVVYAVCG